MRTILTEWEAIGHVPRSVRPALAARLRQVEDALARAGDIGTADPRVVCAEVHDDVRSIPALLAPAFDPPPRGIGAAGRSGLGADGSAEPDRAPPERLQLIRKGRTPQPRSEKHGVADHGHRAERTGRRQRDVLAEHHAFDVSVCRGDNQPECHDEQQDQTAESSDHDEVASATRQSIELRHGWHGQHHSHRRSDQRLVFATDATK